MDKHIYKLKLTTKWKIQDIFYILLLKEDIAKNEQVNKLPKLELELNTRQDKRYIIEVIKDDAIYIKVAKG